MEIFTVLMGLAMPFVIKGSTDIIKRTEAIVYNERRVLLVRMMVAIMAVIGAGLTASVGDAVFDVSLIEQAILAIFNFAAATFIYHKTK